MQLIYKVLALNIVPDALIRCGIRKMLSQKLSEEEAIDKASAGKSLDLFAQDLKNQPIAIATDSANEQHYEVPTEFYEHVLGPRLKYSSAYWDDKTVNLKDAEERMLALTCERAQIVDGMKILELGCGWGSLSIWMAEHYPNSQILAVSNSRTQKEYIDSQAKSKRLENLTVKTCDINNLELDEEFDRVVSVEMFEHLKNYQMLFKRVSDWLKPNGKMFVHIFSHKKYAYHYVNKDGNDWLTEHFFTGGTMPADDLFTHFQEDLRIEEHWQVSGLHYKKTVAAWIDNMDKNRSKFEAILAQTYGKENLRKWWVYWRLFFFACEELFAFRNGQEWIVSHYLFANRKRESAADRAEQKEFCSA